MFVSFIGIITDSINERFPCTQHSARKNFHAATISRLATNEGYDDNRSTDRQRSLLIHKCYTYARCPSTSHNEMLISSLSRKEFHVVR